MKVLSSLDRFTELQLPVTQANRLRKILFAYVLFNAAQNWPIADRLYGPDALLLTTPVQDMTLTSLVNLLSVSSLGKYYWLFIAVQQVFALTGLFGWMPRLSTFLVFFTTINLQNRVYASISGGDMLLNALLFFLVFISSGKESSRPWLETGRKTLDNVFILLCYFQVVLVYFVSALFKLQSPEWLDGSALQKILSIQEYSLPCLMEAVGQAPFLFRLITWAVLAYQVVFPVLVFVRQRTMFFGPAWPFTWPLLLLWGF